MPRIAAIWLVIGIAAGCTSAPSGNQALPEPAGAAVPAPNAGDDYRLAAGDKVKITVEGEKDFSGAFPVDSAGAITVPMVGQIAVNGLTLRELESAYARKLRDGQILRDPKIIAEAVGFRPIYVLGEVKKPGQYAYVSGMTVQSAVALAEGYSYYAKESAAEITRAGRKIDVEVTPDTKVLPGDAIVIPKRFF